MNIQIFGKQKCFDTKKAQRYFKERRIKAQFVDVEKYGMSAGELKSVCASLGLKALIDENARGYHESMIPYVNSPEAKMEKLLENQHVLKTPIVRNGRQATVGYQPEVWKDWQ